MRNVGDEGAAPDSGFKVLIRAFLPGPMTNSR